jgi:hypothetical protein
MNESDKWKADDEDEPEIEENENKDNWGGPAF